ncbi:MAG: glycosyltransferase family 4 protein [Acidobacteria bacterium]|nr:glycosyltransferase family 4 protein [Acidobacteriota bacterium]
MITSCRVHVLVDYRPALRQPTGVGAYVHQMLRALVTPDGPLVAPDDRVSAFTSSWKDRPTTEARAALAGLPFIDRRVPVRPLTWSWHHLAWPPIEWLAGQADVVHASSPLLMPSRRAAGVITIHDLHFLRHPERMRAEMRRDYPARVHAHAQRAHGIVVSSQYTARDVQATLGVPASRITVCPPGVPAWTGAVRSWRARQSSRHFLALGTLEPRKNLGVLLDAYALLRARCPQAPPLVLAGQSTPAAEPWQRRAGASDLAGHVRQPGYVDDETKQRLLAEAHALIMPSLDEGFGLPVLEAMAAGVPVIVSTGGSLPEVAGPAARPIDPHDPETFAAEMQRLLEPDESAAASARSLARAAAFDWSRSAHVMWQGYRAAWERAR